MRYSSLSLVAAPCPGTSPLCGAICLRAVPGRRRGARARHARPAAVVSVPTSQTTIILAMDVSRSMCSDRHRAQPAAGRRGAALAFIEHQRHGTQIGIVAFAGFAELIQPPTTDQEVLLDAVHSLTTGRRTAVGSGILAAHRCHRRDRPSVAPSVIHVLVRRGADAGRAGRLRAGHHRPADRRGEQRRCRRRSTRRSRPPTAACASTPSASARPKGGGLDPACGTSSSVVSRTAAAGLRRRRRGPAVRGAGGFRRGIDEDTLKQVAELTGGEYYPAESASELQRCSRACRQPRSSPGTRSSS